MIVEIAGGLRDALALEVGGSSTDDAENASQRLPDHFRVRQAARQRDDYVMAFFKQVRLALGQGQVDIDLRIELGVTGHQRCQQLDAKPGSGLYPQVATGNQVCTGGFGIGILDLAEDHAAAFQIAHADFGQRQAARAALQQAGLQRGFQLGQQA